MYWIVVFPTNWERLIYFTPKLRVLGILIWNDPETVVGMQYILEVTRDIRELWVSPSAPFPCRRLRDVDFLIHYVWEIRRE